MADDNITNISPASDSTVTKTKNNNSYTIKVTATFNNGYGAASAKLLSGDGMTEYGVADFTTEDGKTFALPENITPTNATVKVSGKKIVNGQTMLTSATTIGIAVKNP